VPEMSWHDPVATESDQPLGELEQAHANVAWGICDAEARCCSTLGQEDDRNDCLIEGAAEVRELSLDVFSRGLVSLSSELLDTCLRELARIGCDEAVPGECSDLLVGSRNHDEGCTDYFECAAPPGSFRACMGDPYGEGQCIVALPAALGEPCVGNCAPDLCSTGQGEACYLDQGLFCAEGVCAALRSPGEACYAWSLENDACQPGNACVAHVCQPRIPLSDACQSGERDAIPCVKGAYCSEGTCAPLGLAGHPCTAPEECLSGICDPTGCRPTLTQCGY
jgi:hypothetical protein